MEINFRPHHFLCSFCFRGRGYSPAFISNFQNIIAYLNSTNGNEAVIHLVNHTDSICAPCPSRQEKMCASQEKITRLDQFHAQALHLTNETQLTWGEAKQRISDTITLATFNRICEPCNWKTYGICETVLRKEGIINE